MSDPSFIIKDLSYPTVVFNAKPLTKTTGPAPILVLIPGNPGNSSFYTEYLDAVQKQMPEFETLIISYAGFTPDKDIGKVNFNETVGLGTQLVHKAEIIRRFVPQDDKRDIYLLGHSVGTFIIEKMFLHLNDIGDETLLQKFKFVGFITPTIRNIALSENGLKLNSLIERVPNLHIYVSKIAYITKLIPEGLMNYILSWKFKKVSTPILDSVKTFVQSRNLLCKCLGLAHEEMKYIRDDPFLTSELVRTLEERKIPFWAWFCHTDYWIHNDTRAELVQVFEKMNNSRVEVYQDKSIKHSFVMKSSDKFADITVKALEWGNRDQ